MDKNVAFLINRGRGWCMLACMPAMVSACAQGDRPSFRTLHGGPPLVVAHRGASGTLPEETLEAYRKAIELGADILEMDLISTRDGVLIARHDPNLAVSTDVAGHPEFAARKRKTQVDGEPQEGWFASDFTLAEIKTLRGISTDPERPRQHDGLTTLVTFHEIIDLVRAESAAKGRTIAVYPETKNPTYHRRLGLPLEDTLIAIIDAAGWNSGTAPVYVQSFEPSSLRYMRGRGLKTKMVQLVDGDGYDFKSGTASNPDASPFARPYDWAVAGDPRTFPAMLTAAGLAEIKTYADGVAPWKPYLVPVKGRYDTGGRMLDLNQDGRADLNDATTQAPTTLVDDSHQAGLFVHPFTFRNEKRRLARDYRGDPKAEYARFYRLGVDGVFSDFPDTAMEARDAYLEELGR